MTRHQTSLPDFRVLWACNPIKYDVLSKVSDAPAEAADSPAMRAGQKFRVRYAYDNSGIVAPLALHSPYRICKLRNP
jgi:hypothetical protein